MKNLISSYRRYVAKLAANPFVPPTIKGLMGAMYGNATARQNEIQLRTKAFLDQLGAPVGLSWAYQAAAAEANKKKAAYSGVTLQNELNIIIDKWTARGVNPAVVDQLVKTIV
jgi:hypothetical protein